MEGTRVPVSTREDGPSPSRKGKKRVYGAQRTESGLNIVEGGDPGKYIMTSPATKEAFERAVDAMAFGQVEETDPPVSETVRDRATVAINAISAEARAEADEGDGQLDIMELAVDKAIDTSRGLEPEDAGALLAATALRLQESDLTAEESRDPRVEALSSALAASFSEQPSSASPFTPSAKKKQTSRASVSSGRRIRRLSFQEEPQPSLAGRAFGAFSGAVGGVAGATAGAASRAIFGEAESPEVISPTGTATPFASPDSFSSPVGVPASSAHGGSPHLSSVVSGGARPDSPSAVEVLQRQRELQRVRQLLQMPPEQAAALPAGGAEPARQGSRPSAGHPHSHAASPLDFIPRQVSRQQAEAQNVAQQQQQPAMFAAAPPPAIPAAVPPGAVAAPDRTDEVIGAVQDAAQRQTRDASLGRRRQTAALTDAMNDAAARQELTAAELQTVMTNLDGGPNGNPPAAPLTAQLVQQGRLQLRQVLDPAEVLSYETALRNRRVKKEKTGAEGRVFNQRLAAQPVLTRYVQEPSEPDGAKRYRRPKFAGPAF
jgi:hypothetical protein